MATLGCFDRSGVRVMDRQEERLEKSVDVA